MSKHTFRSKIVKLVFLCVLEILSDDKSLFIFIIWCSPSSRLPVNVFSFVQLWADVCCCFPQDQFSLHSGEELQESFWRRIPICVSLWERMKTSGSSCATTAGVNSTSTRSASALGNVTTATFIEELLKEPGQISFHPFLSSQENWRCQPETDVCLPLRTCVSLVKSQYVFPYVLKKAFYFR